MVKWRGREGSRNIEDARGGGGGISGIAPLLIRLVLSKFGIGGLAVLAAGFVGLSLVGVDPMRLLSGAPSGPGKLTPQEEEVGQFVSIVLRETEIVWGEIFAASGEQYPPPPLRMFTGQVQSACGFASAAAGPFYCPLDQRVYLDTQFFAELAQRFGAPGDFAAAYVIAHEVGHHVQTVTGISERVRAEQSRVGEEEANAIQVRMELQADCYAGVWANYAGGTRDLLDEGDIEEGLQAASAIGDDTLQRNAGRRVTPESFTHGTSAQRANWFRKGYAAGDPNACDTFGAAQL
jgi:predicted metalloprotease